MSTAAPLPHHRRYVCPHLRHTLEQAPGTESDAPDPLDRLTRREQDVLRLLAVGRTTREAAAAIDLCPKTVSAHRARILNKLGLRNNVELAHFAIAHNLVKP
jgi:two-component system invasion response regulator UvrY